MRSAALLATVVGALVGGCTAPPRSPTTIANVAGPPPPARTTCYAGTHLGTDGERAPLLMRRTLDPSTSTIRQESILGSNGFGFVTDWVAELVVTGETFRSTTSGNSRGEGRLEGRPWAWTHWSELRVHDGGATAGPTEQVDGWLDGTHLRFAGHMREADKRWSAELDAFDCADYQGRVDALEAVEKENAPISAR